MKLERYEHSVNIPEGVATEDAKEAMARLLNIKPSAAEEAAWSVAEQAKKDSAAAFKRDLAAYQREVEAAKKPRVEDLILEMLGLSDPSNNIRKLTITLEAQKPPIVKIQRFPRPGEFAGEPGAAIREQFELVRKKPK